MLFYSTSTFARYGTTPHPACVPAQSNCIDLICNGGFENYDPALNGGSVPIYWGTGIEFYVNSAGISDIQSWRRNDDSSFTTGPFGTTPDLHISGVSPSPGAPTPFGNNMAAIIVSEGGTMPHFPYLTSPSWREGLVTDLMSPIIPEYPYELSFSAYTRNTRHSSVPAYITTPYKTQYVDIVLVNSTTGNRLTLTKAALLHRSVAGGWYQYTFNFTLPKGQVGYDQIEFNGSHIDDNGNTIPYYKHISRYTYLDNFSLVGSDMVLDPIIQHSCTGTNGFINLTITGGTAPYSVSWIGPNSFTAGTQNIQNLAPGDYEVTVKDANNCAAIQTYTVQSNSSQIIYVDQNVMGGANDGTSWANAFDDLHNALDPSKIWCNGAEIWVSEGTYYPSTSPGQENPYIMLPNVKIYGGFSTANNIITKPDRDWNTYLTILSGGGYAQNIIRNENAGLGPDALLDGFILEGANSNSPNSSYCAMFNLIASPTIANCTFRNNLAMGGAAGAMVNIGSSMAIMNCIFYKNDANWAGAISNDGTQSTLINCLFYNNTSFVGPGAMGMNTCADSIINCTFANNMGNKAIGSTIICSHSGASNFINSIFWHNNSVTPPVYCPDDFVPVHSFGTSLPGFKHCNIENVSIDPTCVANSAGVLQNRWDLVGVDNGHNLGGDLIMDDPLFVNLSSDFRLDPGSPSVGRGDNNVINHILTDLDLNPRISGTTMTVDMGAYENQSVNARSAPLSVDDHSSLYRLFPNPTSGFVRLDGLSNDEVISYRVYNTLGEIIIDRTIYNNLIDLSNQPKGIYMIEVFEANQSHIHKLIKE